MPNDFDYWGYAADQTRADKYGFDSAKLSDHMNGGQKSANPSQPVFGDKTHPSGVGGITAGQQQANTDRTWAGQREQYRNTLADSGFAQDYRNSLDQLSQARLREGVGATQRGMAAQAVGRGANPAAQRAAVMQGGQMGLQATNQSAQFAQQADMAGAQMAQAEWARRLQSMEHQEQMRQQALATQAGRYSTNVQARQANQNNSGGGIGDTLGALGGMAAGLGMMFGSDVANKTDIMPMSGAEQAGASVGAMYEAPGAAQGPSMQDQLYQAQMEDIRRRQEMDQQRYDQQQMQSRVGGFGQILSSAGDLLSDERSKSLLMALADENDRMRQALGAAPPRTPESNPLDEAMDSLPAYAYRYKPEFGAAVGQPDTPRAGIMAQDAERHPLTAAMVRETPSGKAIDGPTAIGTSLAMSSRLNERVRKLEALLDAEQGHMDRALAGEGPTSRERSLRARPRSLRDLAAEDEVLELPPDVVPAYSDVVYGGQTNSRGTPTGPSIRMRTADTTPEQIARQQARDARAVRWNDPAEGY